MSNVIELNDSNFESEVFKSDKPVLVDFWAEWCGPCKMIAPSVEKISEEYSDKLKVGKLDVDSNPNISSTFGIRSIPTLLVFKKHRENPNDILFIDASKYFEKVGKQNVLRSEDIDRIIESYQNRKFEDKYSFVATIDDIKDNDYNLNIPRYVDTFEEEEPVDFSAVSLELKQIDEDMKDIDEQIEGYCKELGIDAPK